MNGEFDGAVRQGLFCDGVSLEAGLDSRFFDGVNLLEPVELLRITPAAAVVVVRQRGGVHITHHRISPLR